MGVTDPLGGINTLFPLFGIANQLLAAIALTVVTVVVIKKGLLKWAWIPGIPLLWDLTVTLTASWQKIFSGDPKLGYWTQHFQYRDAKDAGKTAFGVGQEPRPDRRRHPQHVHPGHAVDHLRRAGAHRGSSAGVIVALKVDPRRRAAADRGRPGAVADLRPVRHDPDRRREGGAEAMGRATRARPPDPLVLGTLMGDNHYRRYVDAPRRAPIPASRC